MGFQFFLFWHTIAPWENACTSGTTFLTAWYLSCSRRIVPNFLPISGQSKEQRVGSAAETKA